MKAKLVKEAMEFTRVGDPMDKLQLGDPDIRRINAGLKEVTDIVAGGYSRDVMNFTEVINVIDDLKRAVDYTILSHLKKKYGFEMMKGDREWRVFSTIVKGDRLLAFLKSSTSRSFEMVLYDGPTTDNHEITKTAASTSIKTLDDKIALLNKKYKIL